MRNEEVAAHIETNFKISNPTEEQAAKIEVLNHYAKEFAEMINELCPFTWEQSTALVKVEEAMMWATAGITKNR